MVIQRDGVAQTESSPDSDPFVAAAAARDAYRRLKVSHCELREAYADVDAQLKLAALDRQALQLECDELFEQGNHKLAAQAQYCKSHTPPKECVEMLSLLPLITTCL
jgi:hypothetical protein